MLIYNTSFHVTGERELGRFLDFMHETYLPGIAEGGHMQNTRFVSLITNLGDDIYAYSVMSDIADVVSLKRWKKEVEEALLTQLASRFGDKVLAFSTTMKEIKRKE